MLVNKQEFKTEKSFVREVWVQIPFTKRHRVFVQIVREMKFFVQVMCQT